jgi:biopolymer transport protein ExbD
MSDQTPHQMTPEEEAELESYKARKAKKRKAGFEDPAVGLNINSMMDMMTIILCFLLKSYGSEPISVSQSDDLRLAYSSTEVTPEDMMVITITKRQVMVEDETIIEIRDGQIDASNLMGANSAIIPRLEQRIREELERQAQMAQIMRREERKVVTIVCDDKVPYRILSMVMMTAASAGIEQFKFGVLQRLQGSGVRNATP